MYYNMGRKCGEHSDVTTRVANLLGKGFPKSGW
jgi:hypothetical protein